MQDKLIRSLSGLHNTYDSLCASSVLALRAKATPLIFLVGVLLLSAGLAQLAGAQISASEREFLEAAANLNADVREPEQIVGDLSGVDSLLQKDSAWSRVSQTRDAGTSGDSGDGVKDAICKLFELIENSLGALITTVAGIAALIAAAAGAFRGAWALLVCAVASFILQNLVGVFFGEVCGTGSPSS